MKQLVGKTTHENATFLRNRLRWMVYYGGGITHTFMLGQHDVQHEPQTVVDENYAPKTTTEGHPCCCSGEAVALAKAERCCRFLFRTGVRTGNGSVSLLLIHAWKFSTHLDYLRLIKCWLHRFATRQHRIRNSTLLFFPSRRFAQTRFILSIDRDD